jgi:trehalose/maltose hydrolase-like predicted phosphorylase
MGPALLLLNPAMAKMILQYRFDRMKGAREKSASYEMGYQGFMFP